MTFDEEGNAIDAGTGKIIGKRGPNGTLIVNSPDSQPEPQKPSEPTLTGIQKPVSYSKYEVRPDSEFEIRFCLYFDEGRVRVFTEDAKYKFPECESHWVKFRMWTYKEQLEWKRQCSDLDMQTKSMRLNTDKYDEIKLRHLIKSWSLEQFDPKFKLLHVGGVLSDESYELLVGLFPSIVENIVFMMNQVLEGNR